MLTPITFSGPPARVNKQRAQYPISSEGDIKRIHEMMKVQGFANQLVAAQREDIYRVDKKRAALLPVLRRGDAPSLPPPWPLLSGLNPGQGRTVISSNGDYFTRRGPNDSTVHVALTETWKRSHNPLKQRALDMALEGKTRAEIAKATGIHVLRSRRS
jgi:hypothetical protein